MSKKNKYDYKRNQDGEWVRIQESESDPRKDEDILNEYRGLILKVESLSDDLEDVLDRKQVLEPAVESIMEEAENVLRETKEGAKKEEERDVDPDMVNKLRNKIRENRRQREREDGSGNDGGGGE